MTGWKREHWGLNMVRSPRVTNHSLRLMVALRNREQMGYGGPCSCLENPRDGGAWWAAVYEVAQSWTRVKRLSRLSSSNENNGVGCLLISLNEALEKIRKN